jgi:hypothetical protein
MQPTTSHALRHTPAVKTFQPGSADRKLLLTPPLPPAGRGGIAMSLRAMPPLSKWSAI